MNARTVQQGLAIGGAVLTAWLGSPRLNAQSADALIDKLVDKGILTVKEANDLREESDKGFGQAYQVKSGMSDWVTALKINGDFRGRYESFFADNPAFSDRNRWRYRVRLGVTAVIKDNFEVGVRLGSGDIDNAAGLRSGSDPISNNQTLQNNAAKKGVFLDLVYGKWTPINSGDWQASITAGKMENPFVFPSLVFDRDYTPEGAAQQVVYNLNAKHALLFNLGEFVLDEIGSSSSDPFLLGGQALLASTWSPHVSSAISASYLSIFHQDSLPGSGVPDIGAGNDRTVLLDSTGRYAGLGAPTTAFGTLVADASLTYSLESFPLYNQAFPIRVGGTFLQNLRADDANLGYEVGITFGKAGKKGTWEIGYAWRSLEGDAWWEELTESDFGAFYQNAPAATLATARNAGGGYWSGSNVKGHIVKASYSPLDPVLLTVAWYATDLIEPYLPDSDSHMNRLQVDAVLKF